MTDLLDKDIEIMVLKTLKEVQEAVETVKKMIHKQHGNVKKEIENLKETKMKFWR